jgi:tRNA pseudouridine(38-40) synthase
MLLAHGAHGKGKHAHSWRQVQWNRAARTDKGVSAAGNVVSLKMMIGYPDIAARINAELPPKACFPACFTAHITRCPCLRFTRPVHSHVSM